jgi:threonine dehydratase
MNLSEAIMAAQKRAQARQAAQAPAGSPETMPGLATPGMGAEQQAAPAAPQGMDAMLAQLGGGGGGAAAAAQPSSPGGVLSLANSLGK